MVVLTDANCTVILPFDRILIAQFWKVVAIHCVYRTTFFGGASEDCIVFLLFSLIF